MINDRFPEYEAESEVRVQVREGKYLIPDLIVQRRDKLQDPYPTAAVHLCIEILSPEDRFSAVCRKCEDYHDWGVATAWILDPESRRAWDYHKTRGLHEVTGSLTAEAISIPLADVFAVL